MEEMEGVGLDRRCALLTLQDSASGTEDDGLSASEDDDDEEIAEVEDDEETMEKKDKIKQLTSEVKALESAIEKKKASFTGGNPIMMVSHTDQDRTDACRNVSKRL
jgi:TATA-binding protein-associated factor Taf7